MAAAKSLIEKTGALIVDLQALPQRKASLPDGTPILVDSPKRTYHHPVIGEIEKAQRAVHAIAMSGGDPLTIAASNVLAGLLDAIKAVDLPGLNEPHAWAAKRLRPPRLSVTIHGGALIQVEGTIAAVDGTQYRLAPPGLSVAFDRFAASLERLIEISARPRRVS